MPDTPIPVSVLVEIQAKPSQEPEVLDGLITITRQWAEEPGCTQATVLRDPADTARFLVVEAFVSEAAFREHVASPSAGAFARHIQDYLAEPPSRTIWEPVHTATKEEVK